MFLLIIVLTKISQILMAAGAKLMLMQHRSILNILATTLQSHNNPSKKKIGESCLCVEVCQLFLIRVQYWIVLMYA
jgi:hypothetical protein